MAQDVGIIETWIQSDGHGNPPRLLPCFTCRTEMRRKPGNRYYCPECDSDTTVEVLEVRKAKKKLDRPWMAPIV